MTTLFKNIIQSGEIEWKAIAYQAFIFSVFVSSVIIIFSNFAFNCYVDSNYFFYIAVFCSMLVIISPVITVFLIPIFFILHFLFVLHITDNAKKLGKEEKIVLIKEKLSKLKIKNISAENLSRLVLLPKKEVAKVLNIMVTMKQADLTVDKNYKILYKIHPDIDNIVQNIVKRMFDAS